MTVLFVEHDMDMVRDISDWVVVMAAGQDHRRGHRRRRSWPTQRVIDAYLGSHHDAAITEEDEQERLARARPRSPPRSPHEEKS